MPTENSDNLKNVKGQVTLSREGTRTWLAKAVVYIFVGAVLVATGVSIFTDIAFDTFNITISTLSGLFGVVLGFYFAKETDLN